MDNCAQSIVIALSYQSIILSPLRDVKVTQQYGGGNLNCPKCARMVIGVQHVSSTLWSREARK